ncbi:MAG: hypothetical protein HFE30_05390 [Clostridiales bacterium]|nr:hypothetical protein [Clostridiales bacterium]
MEVISVIDVLKQMKFTFDSGEMSLKSTNHKISLCYSILGMNISGTLDGIEIENCNYKTVHRMLDEITENGRYIIKLINPRSSKWKKIRMSDEKLRQIIDDITADYFKPDTHLFGYKYTCEALYEICRKHIDGKSVNVDRTLKSISKSRGVKSTAIQTSIYTSARNNYHEFYENLKPEYKKDILESWCTPRIFVRNFSHYTLDRI